MNVTVLGAGAWGTALAQLLHNGGHSVTLWGHDTARLNEIRRTSRNEPYLPSVELSSGLKFEGNLETSAQNAECLIIAVPSKAFRAVTQALDSFLGTVVSVTKGIEFQTGLTMCGVLAQTIPRAKHATLSGPSFALEVARGIPTAVVVAGSDKSTVLAVQHLFHQPTFRTYSSLDWLGVELGGALKNVIAIGAGVCDGLGFGDNSKAALVTRAMAELRRLGGACGAQPETFAGLSGMGDLMVTCFSRLSRNRGFGERLGKGEKPDAIAASMKAVAEGFPTARSAHELARKHNVETPIIEGVHAMLYEGRNVHQAVRDLLTRESKAED